FRSEDAHRLLPVDERDDPAPASALEPLEHPQAAGLEELLPEHGLHGDQQEEHPPEIVQRHRLGPPGSASSRRGASSGSPPGVHDTPAGAAGRGAAEREAGSPRVAPPGRGGRQRGRAPAMRGRSTVSAPAVAANAAASAGSAPALYRMRNAAANTSPAPVGSTSVAG